MLENPKESDRFQCRSGDWLNRRLKPAVSLFVAWIFWLAQVQGTLAAIDNTAFALGSYNSVPVISNTSSQAIPVVPANPQIAVSKTGVLNDDDGTPGLSAGDTISYTVEVTNPGNVSLTSISVSDPLVSLVFQSGDLDADNELDPIETWTYTASYVLTAGDITSNGGGDGDIDNTVTATSNEAGPVIDTEETDIDPTVSVLVTKNGTLNDDDGTPGISAGDTIDYVITVNNNGLTDLTNVSLADTLTQSGVPTNLVPVFSSGDTNGDVIVNAGETWTYTVSYTLTQANVDDGDDLSNTVSVTTDQIGPRDATHDQPLTGIPESYTMTKIANLVDGDGDNLADAGEVINYTFRFTNTGNRTIANLRTVDPLPGLSTISCANDGDVDGDIDLLAPGQTLDCSASYTVQSSDIASGSVVNSATTSATRTNGVDPVAEDDTANDNSTTTPTDSSFDLDVTKEVASAVEILPNIVEIEYLISITNPASVAQTNLRVEDDIAAAISAPASLIGDAVISSFTGFSGPGTTNPGYNGSSDIQILTGDVQLAASATGQIGVRFMVDRRAQDLETLNVALATSDQIPGNVPSDDPNETPGDPNDTNPTPFNSPDVDGDGSPDADETTGTDRDGDGIADANDYDPTGYFYCEEDGRILSGGLIAVQNVTAGGTQTGLGSSSNVTILQDGSGGFYQFYVTAPGTYRLLLTLPTTGIASTTRLDSGSLDVTSLLPFNPAVIGAGEFGSTGVLADFSAGANPFFTEFVIENGDPTIFNNNIPIALCGTPSVAADKLVTAGPTAQPGGSHDITYSLIAENSGTSRVDNVSIVDDLDAAFGVGNYTITNTSLGVVPAGFGASIEPTFDGSANTSVLTAGGSLEAGETAEVILELNVNIPVGTQTNVITVGGDHSLSGLPLPTDDASISITITGSGAANGVLVSKTTPVDSAPLGARIPYTITFENTGGSPVIGADLIDRLPPGFTYVQNSAEIDGVSVEPVIAQPDLVWSGRDIAPGATTTIRLLTTLGAGVVGTEFTNYAFARNPADGSLLSNQAEATVRLEIESVFQCSHIIGRVFDDLDKDGYHDIGEPGLGGVRLATVNGLLITTDQFGRYHIACDAIPDDRIGSNYILKLDSRTLPTGYRVTSENPRVVRLTRGKLSKINFAASNLRRIVLALDSNSFRSQDVSLKPEAIQDIARILPILEEERAVLVLRYNDTDSLEKDRKEAVKDLIGSAWKSRKRPHRLIIEDGTSQR